MANASVKVDLSGLRHKMSEGNFKKAKLTMSNQALLDMNKLVPKDKGKLRASGHVTSDGSVQWSQIYARSQFYGIVTNKYSGRYPVNHYTTPGTGKRWDLKGKALYSEKWSRVFVRGLNLK
jgi:Minor capsid.